MVESREKTSSSTTYIEVLERIKAGVSESSALAEARF